MRYLKLKSPQFAKRPTDHIGGGQGLNQQQTWGNSEMMSFAVDPISDKAVIASSIKGQCLTKRSTKSNLKSNSNLIIIHSK